MPRDSEKILLQNGHVIIPQIGISLTCSTKILHTHSNIAQSTNLSSNVTLVNVSGRTS